ncbi:DNA cytosine methyltransferase [Amycolatopsis alba]|uniref:Cytosine-specific methyltransferase n=1 Tax=Amycolatopsis alba DSM 44262 TaxID=1125972 RepID=A0A229RDC5_AMYAL|nr:DNA cytosine methyltransferase [Amycolatopsis alba]OXM44647.1 DNA (cytosine-5-)-methyltransferase [Amycolatopsis alba DSM 44262]
MERRTFADLFSGGGGMSHGFFARGYEVVGAVDAQVGKPSSGKGTLECNATFEANMGVAPYDLDLGDVTGAELDDLLEPTLRGRNLDVLSACPPCTGFSRANPNNHLVDDPRNSLIYRVADHVAVLQPKMVVMENARELLQGNFRAHFLEFRHRIESLGYQVYSGVHMLSRFGVPQKRERSLVIAVRGDHELRTLDDLWDGMTLAPEAATVRRAIGHLRPVAAGEADPLDPMHFSPATGTEATRRRLHAMPHDGGSWADLRFREDADELLTPAMQRSVAAGKLGSYPDIYGRMWWDRPAPTIKRECSHFGNGRYTHPEQDRLCTVREMALLTGFPDSYEFRARATSNMYRHIGDAVPPIVSYQLAAVADWILTGDRPELKDALLSGTHLTAADLVPAKDQLLLDVTP